MSQSNNLTLLTTKEIAARYGVAQSTFLLWVHSKIVPAETKGPTKRLFDPAKVEAALMAHVGDIAAKGNSKLPRFEQRAGESHRVENKAGELLAGEPAASPG